VLKDLRARAALFAYYGLNGSLEAGAQLSPRVRVEAPRLGSHQSRAEAANIATAHELAGQAALRDDRYPGTGAGVSVIDTDRLRALEERVAELESWRGR
jgi:hypothetical protein